MKVDILSDLHLDFYFLEFPSKKDIRKVFDSIFVDSGDILIIAGDIGHDNQQNINILKMIQRYYYKHIICILGNHDYLKYYFVSRNFTHDAVNELWKRSINDSRYLHNIDTYDEVYKREVPKTTAVYQKCDVMITHVNPSFLHENMSEKYINNMTNSFFSFDGHSFMNDGRMKYWVFGHTHDAINYEYNGVKCICNPLGYPNENYKVQVKSITL